MFNQTQTTSHKFTLFLYFVIWLITLSIGIHFRLFPLNAFIDGDSQEKASLLVINNLRRQVHGLVDRQHPQLTKEQKAPLYKKSFDELLHKERHRVRTTIEQMTKQIQGDAQLTTKDPYLLASDSYYYYSLTENLLQTGKLGDERKGSKYLNTLMMAPEGHWEPFTLHPYIGYLVYQGAKIFNNDMSLRFGLSFTPLVISALSLILFLAICAQLSIRPLISSVGAIFFLLAPIFLKRTMFGWYDNDPYNALLPLAIVLSMILGLKYLKSRQATIIFAVMTIFMVLLYALIWQGWVLMYSILFAAAIAIIICHWLCFKDKAQMNNLLIYCAIIILGSFAAVGIAFGPKEFFVLFQEGWVAMKNFLRPQLSPWPDLYISVGELKKSSLNDIIELSGGPLFFYTGFLGSIFFLIHAWMQKNKDALFASILIVIFLCASLIIAKGAQRFTMLSLIPLSIGFVLGLTLISDAFEHFIIQNIKNNSAVKLILKLILFTGILILGLWPIQSTRGTERALLNPIYNSTWELALTKIKDQTPKDSIITAWWSPGHFIKATAERRVTFDGATINKPQAYWVANIFLSQTEQQALGLIRMLNNSANQAAEYLTDLGIPLSTSVLMLKEITKLDPNIAAPLLLKALKTPQRVSTLLNMTHASPPPSYILLYNEFVDSNVQLPFIGQWNFKKIEEINANPELMAQVPPRNSPQYIDFLWDLVGGQYKYSKPLVLLKQTDDILTFEHNIEVDLKSKDCTINSPKYGKGKPYSIFYLDGQNIREQTFDGATLSYSTVLYKHKNEYHCLLMDRILANSLLVKLYFFDGVGLDYFEKIIHEQDLTGRTDIRVYKVDWEKYLRN